MKLSAAIILANELIIKWGLDLKGWTFEFNKRKGSLGMCAVLNKPMKGNDKKKFIMLSSPNTILRTPEEVEQTILHEIAHALDWEETKSMSHGYNWKKWCRKVGYKGSRISTTGETAKGKYTLTCKSCEDISYMHRKPKGNKACYDCCNKHNYGRYSEEYKLEVTINW